MPRAIKGKTDLWTTSPNVAAMLVDKKLGYTVTNGSHKKTDFICSNCGAIVKNKEIRRVCSNGLRCPICDDGISYPEKVIYNMFLSIGITPSHDQGMLWSNHKRYDFYIKEYSMICEVHGEQHYSSEIKFGRNAYVNEHENDAYKRSLALANGIEHYIELDCSKSEFNYIYNSIINSELSDIFDINSVDWDFVKTNSLKSILVQVCNLYNNGINNIHEIANTIGIYYGTVDKYLRRGTDAGLCVYNGMKKYKDDNKTWYRKEILCIETGKVYYGLNDVVSDGYNKSQVSACCNNRNHVNTTGGHHFVFLDEYDPETYVMKPNKQSLPKRVLCIEDNKIYECISDVKKDGYTVSSVSQVCNGNASHHKHKHFRFID